MHGKPALNDFPEVQFNLTHSGELALLAVTRDVPLGIDVEQRARIVRSLPAIERQLSASERSELAGLTEPQRQATLARLWVCKEAWIKGTGEGLTRPLDSFDVSLTGDQPQLMATRPLAHQAAEWRLSAIELAEPYVAALAVQSPSVEINIRDWSAHVP